MVEFDDIVNAVSAELRVSRADMMDLKLRRAVAVRARHLVWLLAREMTELTYDGIRRRWGTTSHTTMVVAVNKLRRRLLKDRWLRESYDRIKTKLEEL